jgi:DNA ligase-1
MKNNIIKSFEDLAAHEAVKRDQGYQFKIAMYKKTIRAFKQSNSEPQTLNEAVTILKTVFKNPEKIQIKLQELYNTGKIKAVNKARSDPITQAVTLLSSVPQIGPVKAKQLVIQHNIYTVKELKKNMQLLNDKQKLGLKYYDELIDPKTLDAVRIPRSEIDVFKNYLKKELPDDLIMEICGSYRRGTKNSGDIDILFTGNKKSYDLFVKTLLDKNIIKDPFSSGRTKWMGMGKINDLHRRIDLMYIIPEEYPFALLYFTGSQEFNTELRSYCNKFGYSLNEHKLTPLFTNIKYISLLHNFNFETEHDIFKFLKLKYIIPTKRNSGQYTLNNEYSSVKLASIIQEPKDKIHCLKGKGLGGFTISEMRNIMKNKGLDYSGTKKDICNRLFKEKENVNSVFNVSKGVLLAEKYKDTDPTGMYASEKFDGIRAIWNGSQLKSRTDKTIHAPEWFVNYFPNNYALDGELYLKRSSFEATSSIVSKKVPIDEEWKNIKYMIFDLPSSNDIFSVRIKLLENIVKIVCTDSNCPLVITKHTIIKSKEQMKNLFNNIVSKNGEGLMLRDPNSKYVQKRSKTLLKVKPTDDAEAIIINMVEGKGKDKNSMGAMIMQTVKPPLLEFRIGTGFTQAMRKQFWNKKNDMIGNTVTYTYKGLTTKGVPRHSAFMRLRVNKNY